MIFRSLSVLALTLTVVLASATKLYSQEKEVIKVHFLYGSKPANGFKKTESKFFGGLHGGHVNIEVAGQVGGFIPGEHVHMVAHKKRKSSFYTCQTNSNWIKDTLHRKYTSIEIPITTQQKQLILELFKNYEKCSPYDYAFLGMRCASSAREILAQAGILKKKSKLGSVIGTFYPKPLRRRLLRLAKKNNWEIIKTTGRVSRKWEKD